MKGYNGHCHPYDTLPYCSWAMVCGIPAAHCLPSRGQWAENSRITPPHRLGEVCNGTLAIHGDTACGQSSVDIVHYTAHRLTAAGRGKRCNIVF